VARLFHRVPLPLLTKLVYAVPVLVAAVGYVAFKTATTEDGTIGQSSICEIHKVKMKPSLVPLTYGLVDVPVLDAEYLTLSKTSFPHRRPDQVRGGCIVTVGRFGPKRHARIFVCDRCEANWLAWENWLRKGCCRLVPSPVAEPLLQPASLKPGPVRQTQLPQSLVLKIGRLAPKLHDVYPLSVEEWIDTFRRYRDPEEAMIFWWYLVLLGHKKNILV